VTGAEPHVARGRQILATHPELRLLAGPLPQSAAWTLLLVSTQTALAFLLVGQPWYVWLPCAYVVGATIDHALFVLIHETAHNLVFRWRTGNRLTALLANVPLVFPAAISFCKYHLLHHRHMGEIDLDADIPGPAEARLVGKTTAGKATWLAALALVLGTIRPRRIKSVPFLDFWTVANLLSQAAVVSAVVVWAGVEPLKYLTMSMIFAVGLHPLGARWIQEHYVFKAGQETYSYYGPLNHLSFNVGYHNEHHDLITVPWLRLPQVRRGAPEFYDALHAHWSWTGLLIRFLRDRQVTLFSRIVRSRPAS
jgi:sphingolipid delta-4 desaturase